MHTNPTAGSNTSTMPNFTRQIICEPFCNYSAPELRLWPLYRESLLCASKSTMSHLQASLIDGQQWSVPGRNLRVVFSNDILTYEDGLVMSETAARRFPYMGEIQVRLPGRWRVD